VHFVDRPFTMTRTQQNPTGRNGCRRKNVCDASFAHIDLLEHLDGPAVLRLLALYQFDSHIGLLIQLIVGLDRQSDGFLDAVAYPAPCSQIELDSFPGRSSPETPRARHQAKFPCRLQPISVPRFNLEKVELSSTRWLTKTVNAPLQALET